MKIIQSFWSGGINDITQNNFGWQSPYFHLLSWVLSANQLLKFHEEVELYTDKLGARILIDQLGLPYTKVHIVLDDLNDYDSNLWALAKIRAYELQDVPFIHVDGDVYIWEKFHEKLESSTLLAQNLEVITEYYTDLWKDINQHLNHLPEEMKIFENGFSTYACNMGIVGGTDLSFFKKYCSEAFNFVNNNKNSWKGISNLNFNIFFEQVLFYELAKNDNVNVSFLIDEIPKDNQYKGFGDFHKVPHKRKYLHLLGNYKTDHYSVLAMRDYVIKVYPEFHHRILEVLNIKMTKYNFQYGFNKIVMINNFIKTVMDDRRVKINDEYLIARNLVFVDLPRYFDDLLLNNELIILKKLSCSSIILKKGTSVLKIVDIGNNNIIIPIDELDKLLLSVIKRTSNYYQVFDALQIYLEDEVKNNKNNLDVFYAMIADRIRFFITRKILFCYNYTN